MSDKTGIEIKLERILDEFAADEREMVAACVSKAAKKAKRDVVAASPVGQGDYKKGWTVRTQKTAHTVTAIVYNKDKPGLTHLLEKSHVIRNASGTYGRTSEGHGQVVHIAPAAEAAEEYLVDLLMQAHGEK